MTKEQTIRIDNFVSIIKAKQKKFKKGCGFTFEGIVCGEHRYCSNCYIRLRKYEIKLRTIKQIRKLLDSYKEVEKHGKS